MTCYVCEAKNGIMFRYYTNDIPDKVFGIRLFIIEGGVYHVVYGPADEDTCLKYIQNMESKATHE